MKTSAVDESAKEYITGSVITVLVVNCIIELLRFQSFLKQFKVKKTRKGAVESEMLAEYDFSGGIRGMYAKRFETEEVTVRVDAPEIKKRAPGPQKKRRES